ncbi:hypothetical protein [Spirulina major]|uniref:hypothetical protein n=1 Tax=Spirulina major TaxID=270636 RepID=UPI00093353DA|nr:hypothetical protein [Spirulina major]
MFSLVKFSGLARKLPDWTIAVIIPQAEFMGAITANVRRTLWACGLALLGQPFQLVKTNYSKMER